MFPRYLRICLFLAGILIGFRAQPSVVDAQRTTLQGLLTIGEVQGNGDISPFINQTVTFRGVVTGFYADRNTQGITFHTAFVQDLPGLEDGDPATSDGIALFLGRERPSFNIGDQVRVSGVVTEFFGFTELDDNDLSIQVEATGVPLPDPIPIDPPADNAQLGSYFEPLEGMLVTIDGAARVVGPTFSGCGFAVVGSDVETRLILRRMVTDPIGQIVPILHHNDVNCNGFPDVKTGDEVIGLLGPLIYHFDQFKLVHQEPADLSVAAVPLPSLPQPPPLDVGQFSIATFNLENHFDTVDDTGDDAEPKPSAAEIAIKQEKLAYALSQTLDCPTLVGIQEVEKASLLLALAEEAAPACGFAYQVTHLESVDVRGIDVALLSDPRRVAVHQARLQQACTTIDTGLSDPSIACAGGMASLFSRPPLQVDVSVAGRPYSIFVNHFKSKREGEAETAPRRLEQANHINSLVEALLAQDAAAQIIVLGDFNDYELSSPLLAMTETGHLVNLLSSLPDLERYSFVFGGAAQLLDGVLVSPAVADQVRGISIMHVNADYPAAWAQDVSPARLMYRSTDHDLPLVVLGPEDRPDEPPTAVPPTAVPPSPTIPQPPIASPTVVLTPTTAPQPTNIPEPPPSDTGAGIFWIVGLIVAGIIGLVTAVLRRGQQS